MKGGVEGEFEGRVYPLVVGLKSGPRTLHFLGEGATYEFTDEFLVAREANDTEEQGLRVPRENVAFVASPFFFIEK